MIPLTPVITAVAAVVFVSCLLYRAFRQRRQSDAISTGRHRLDKLPRVGRHWREPHEHASPVLVHALKTVGTHGLGFIRESEAV